MVGVSKGMLPVKHIVWVGSTCHNLRVKVQPPIKEYAGIASSMMGGSIGALRCGLGYGVWVV